MSVTTGPANLAITTDGYDTADMRKRLKAILVGSVGNLIEWYDVYAYSAFALYFAGSFFPNSDPVAGQLAAASLFAVAFLVRPIGSLIFGYFADRYGRRTRSPSLCWLCVLGHCS
jgi:MHS family alpha-ketoglutarate permease-like MFS transporter